MDTLSVLIFPILVFSLIGFVLYSMYSKSGKGRMLGGTIIKTAREEITQKSGITTRSIRSHVIEKKNSKQRHIGIEIFDSQKLGASLKPVILSKNEAEKLVRMLNESMQQILNR